MLDECVRAAQGLTSAEAVRVLRKAWLAAGAFDGGAVAHVLREKQKALRRVPALSFQDAGEDLTEVGGLGELKRWLSERRRAFGAEARAFGLPVPRGLLLLGVQGCGKSLSAKAVAREWRFPLLRLDLAAAFGDRSRSPEVTMREATAVAESLAPAVLWIDEIEKGFAATDRDPAASRVFGAFLTWLAEKDAPVFVVATANDVTALPPELLRRGRFDELFFVDLPERERARRDPRHPPREARARPEAVSRSPSWPRARCGSRAPSSSRWWRRASTRRSASGASSPRTTSPTRSRRRCRSTRPTRSASRSCATGRAPAPGPPRSTPALVDLFARSRPTGRRRPVPAPAHGLGSRAGAGPVSGGLLGRRFSEHARLAANTAG